MNIRNLFSRKQSHATERKGFTVNVTSALAAMFGRNVVAAKGHATEPTDNSVVTAALRWVTRNVPSAPQVTERYVGTRYETIAAHPATRLLRRPNANMTGSQLNQAIALSLVLDGNAYVYKARNGNGRLVELSYLPHYSITPVGDPTTGVVAYYEYSAPSGNRTFMPEEIIHVRDGLDPLNGMKGWSGLKSVIYELLSDHEATVYTYSLLKNLGITGLVISPKGDGVITEEQAEIVKAKLKESTTGENRGEPLIAGQGIDISTTGYSPEQMALDKIRIIPEARILAVIGIPAMVLNLVSGETTRTFSNYGEARKSVFEEYLLPLWTLIDEAVTFGLAGDLVADNEQVTRDLTKVPAQRDVDNEVSERVQAEYVNGVITRAEARQQRGYPTTPADDVYYLDAQAAGLNTDVAKQMVKADVLAKKRARELAGAA